MQWLKFERLIWDKGAPETARYHCTGCDHPMQEHDKTAMLSSGEWRATAEGQDPHTIGFHISALYSPVGWHLSDQVAVLSNITLPPLPPKCPEINVMENVWQFMRDNCLSIRVFEAHDDIVDHCRNAWNRLVDKPSRIMSIGMREWTHGF